LTFLSFLYMWRVSRILLVHFHGLWALGSLMGTTIDVDLPTLYSQNVV
jgi:hypothetical protein